MIAIFEIKNKTVNLIEKYSECRCIYRLSYYQRIRDMMPEPYIDLIPALPEPIYKYSSEGASTLREQKSFFRNLYL